MASDRSYLEFVLEQLSGLDDISYRPMMSEYIIYCQGKVIGGIYDNRFLVKQTESSLKMLKGASKEKPYEGGRDMLLVNNIDDREFLCSLIEAMTEELPEVKKRKKK